MFRTIQNWLIPDALRKDGEAFGRANRVIAFDLALCFFGPIFSTIFWVLGAPISSAIVDVAMASLLVNLVYLRTRGNLQVCGHVVTAVAWFTSSSKRSRESVVALAATASNASPAKNRIHKNRRRCTKLISIHLQHAARGGLVKIRVLYEKRAPRRH